MTRSPATRAVPVVATVGEPVVDVPVATVPRRVVSTPVQPSACAARFTADWFEVRVAMVAPMAMSAVVSTRKHWCQIPAPAVVVTPEPTAVAWLAVAVAPPTLELVMVGAVTEAMLSQVPVMWMSVPARMTAPVVLVTARVVPAVVESRCRADLGR
jgi:hypothetical protein